MAADPLAHALAHLYAARLDDFLALRKKLVAELRAAGDAPAARQLASAAKPARTAWALNQVVRRQPELLQALLRAREAAAAPSQGEVDELRRTTRDYRDRVNEVVKAAREVLAEDGIELNVAQGRRVAETLQAAGAEDGETRARLLAGTLTHDVDVEDPFAGLAVGEGGPARVPATEPRGKSESEKSDRALEQEREKERREREQAEEKERKRKAEQAAARARVAELEDAARDARAEARTAESTAARAAREAERAKTAADAADARLEAARAELARLTS